MKQTLMMASSAIPLLLGLAHLLYTFQGPKLLPKDPAVIDAMKSTSLVITKETTVWKAWIGFNASHSLAAILFGLIFGYLAFIHPDVFFASTYLQAVGFFFLLSFLVLARAFWFSAPLIGVSVALALYTASLFVAYQ